MVYSLLGPLYKKKITPICRRKLKRLKRKGNIVLIPNSIFLFENNEYMTFIIREDIGYDIFYTGGATVTFCNSVKGLIKDVDKLIMKFPTKFVENHPKSYRYGKYNDLILIFKTKKECSLFKLSL